MSENCENDNCLILDRYVVADKISVQLVADGQNDTHHIGPMTARYGFADWEHTQNP